MAFLGALILLTGIFIGVAGYRLYLQRLHKMSIWIRKVQQGGRIRKGAR